MMKYALSLIWFISISFIAVEEENYIQNPGFETYSFCPTKYGDLKKCAYWEPTSLFATPDLFSRCYYSKDKEPGFGVPKNFEGYKLPVSGNAYAGCLLFSANNYFYREYLQNQLSKPLEKGKTYELSFYMSKSDSSEYTSPIISYAFIKYPDGKTYKQGTPMLSSYYAKTIKLPEQQGKDWFQIKVNYTAKGGERYVQLGLFYESMSEKKYTDYIKKHYHKCNDRECGAYYYFDDFKLIELTPIRPKF